MAIHSVTSNHPVAQVTPAQQPAASKQIDRPAERTAPPAPATTAAPSVNTNGQTIGTTISTSA